MVLSSQSGDAMLATSYTLLIEPTPGLDGTYAFAPLNVQLFDLLS